MSDTCYSIPVLHRVVRYVMIHVQCSFNFNVDTLQGNGWNEFTVYWTESDEMFMGNKQR